MAVREQATAVEVRRLTTLDVFRMARIINKCSTETKQELLDAVVTEPVESAPAQENGRSDSTDDMTMEFNPTKLFFAIAAVLDEAEEPMVKFIASLADMKPQQLNEAPPETAIEILITVFRQEQEHLSDFLASVAGLMNETSG